LWTACCSTFTVASVFRYQTNRAPWKELAQSVERQEADSVNAVDAKKCITAPEIVRKKTGQITKRMY